MKSYIYFLISFIFVWGNVNAAEQVNTVSFDGTSQYLRFTPVTPGVTSFSISTWVRADDLNGVQMIASQFDGGASASNRRLFYCWLNGSTLEFGLKSSLSFTSVSKAGITANTWFHVAAVYNGINLKLYIDGVEEDSVSLTENLDTSFINDLSIGGQYNLSTGNAGNKFDGSITNFAAFDEALTSTQVSEIYNSGTPKAPWLYSQAIRDSYIAALPLNDGTASGREFEDYSGKENNPSLVGSPTLTGSTLNVETGEVFTAFDFNGSTEFINCGNNSSLQITGNISVSCWVKFDSVSNSYYMMSKHTATGNQRAWLLGYESGNGFVFALRSSGTGTPSVVLYSSAVATAGKWYHVTGIYDGTNAKLYIDGEEDATAAYSAGIYNSSADVLIGAVNANSFLLDGSLTQPLIFNRNLTATEVKTLYNQNLPKKFSELPASIKDDAVLALELNSNDNSLIDLSGNNNNGTANGGVTSDGSEIDVDGVLIDPADLANTTTGHNAGTNNTGINNTFLGSNAGYNNTSGEGNVFIGSYAGADETGSNKLYIANSNTATPLVYGEFDNQKLQINGELRVTGGILANKVHVKLAANWPDYVFAKAYKLLSLEEVEDHINEHKHLPGIPPAKEIENGTLSIDEVMVKQMEKIEELTLYILKLKKENQKSTEAIQILRKQKEEILNRLNALERVQN